jgi:uncharacterized repeat protein (TIGR02543 family)
MDDNKSVTAVFTQGQYSLTVTVMGNGNVSLSKMGPYHYGDVVTLTATANTGWTFSGWTGDVVTTTNPATITINNNQVVTATFTQNEYTLDTLTQGSGSVSKSKDGPYYYGDVVTLEATADAGWGFTGWSGDLSGSTNPITITIDGNKTTTAIFAQNQYVLILNIAGQGTVSRIPDQTTYTFGQAVTLTASAANGWTFGGWSGDLTGSTNPVTITIDGDKTVAASFAQITYTLSTSVVGQGSVTKNPDLPSYTPAQQVVVTAVPQIGWTFTGWSGACSGSGTCMVTMDSDKVVTAAFTQNEYTVTVATVGNGSVSLSDVGPYHFGDIVQLTATPDTGWSFVNWSGDVTGNSNQMSLIIDNNKTVTANFTNQYMLDVYVAGQGSVIKNPNQSMYTYGTSVQLTATAVEGWSFTGWSGDITGITNSASILITGNKVVTATFTQDQQLPKNLIVNQGTLRENFDSMTGWTVSGSPSGYSAVVDTTNYKVGTGAIRLTTPINGNVYISKTVNWDLSASNEQGNLRLWVYVNCPVEPYDFRIYLSNDSTFQNYFIAWQGSGFKFRYLPGWNLINVRTSDWKVGGGSPSWTRPIVQVRIRFDNNVSCSYTLDGLTTGVVAQPAILFTFDDGYISAFTQAFSFMKTRNVRGTSYVVTDWVNGTNMITWSQLQEMYGAGWTIGNHTNTHPHLPTLSEVDQEAAILNARSALNAHGMINADYFDYPFGEYNTDSLTAMNNLGMRSGRTILNFNTISPLAYPYLIPQSSIYSSTALNTVKGWVDIVKTRQEILVITMHGISASPGTNDWYIDRFQGLVDYCIQQGIPILTMDDLYRLQSGDITIPVAR